MLHPLVSVLLPVRDAAATLAAALDSVQAQTLREHEVVVVLDGCADASADIVAARARADARVRPLHQPAHGLVAALNAGLVAARAPLVARHDADDRMRPERLAAQAAALDSHPEWDAVTCGVAYAAPPGAPAGPGMARFVAWLNGLATPAAIRAARFIDAPVAHPAVMYRRHAILEAGGYHDGPFPEDTELWLRLLAARPVIGRVPDVLMEWQDRPDRLTRVDARYARAAAQALMHRFLLAGPLAGGRRCRVWGAGPYGRRHARDLGRAGALIDDLIDIDPRKIGRRVAGGRPVRGVESVGPPDGRLILVAVAAAGARAQVAAWLEERGHRLEEDYLPVQ
ncbi:MAG TPA: glycosyltransferase [Polyangia bacterium]|jgi:glycosyltransferase involved in cell wall biosynthesis